MQSEVDFLRRSVVREIGKGRNPPTPEVDGDFDFASMIATIEQTLAAFGTLDEKLRECEEDLHEQRQITAELRARATEAERELATATRLLTGEKDRVAVLQRELKTAEDRKRVMENGTKTLGEQIHKLAVATAPAASIARTRHRDSLSA